MARRRGSSAPVIGVEGAKSNLEIFLGRCGCSRTAPVVIGAAAGGFNHEAGLANSDLRELFTWLNLTPTGAWVGLAGPERMTLNNRPVGFIQSNTSSFYDAGHAPGGSNHPGIWRDFYFQTTFTLLDRLDREFRSEEIEIMHPTLNADPWSESMQGVVLDALGQLAETRVLALRRIHLSCTHRMTAESLGRVAAAINREQGSTDPPLLREPTVTAIAGDELGVGGCDRVKLWRIDV